MPMASALRNIKDVMVSMVIVLMVLTRKGVFVKLVTSPVLIKNVSIMIVCVTEGETVQMGNSTNIIVVSYFVLLELVINLNRK